MVRVQLMKDIADNIKSHKAEPGNAKNSTGDRREYYVNFVPRRTMICERVLEDEGVYDGKNILMKYDSK